MKQKILSVVSVIIVIIGVGVIIFPSLVKEKNRIQSDNVVKSFDEVYESMYSDDSFDISKDGTKENDKTKKKTSENGAKVLTKEQLDAMYKHMQKYNKELYDREASRSVSPFVYEDAAIDLSQFGVEDGLVGYVSAPAIDMKLPIYLGASEYNLYRGAAHMNRTSLPIGGENTNCALAGHRGLISRTMFDNIVYLQISDDVYIKNYFDELHYKVKEIKIVDPNDCANSFRIQQGKDLLTLFTCHPYGHNSQRYLVICKRVK